MSFAPLPATAARQHRGVRSGFEVVYFGPAVTGATSEGWTAAIEDGATWAVEYAVQVDAAWEPAAHVSAAGRPAGSARP